MRVQVYEHDVAALSGSGAVTDIQTCGGRVFALELFGSLTLFDCTWLPGRRHAALMPLVTYRDRAWLQAFVPLSPWAVVAAVHEDALAGLRLDEHFSSATPRQAGVCCCFAHMPRSVSQRMHHAC